MKISNLRLEHSIPFKFGKPQAHIICDLEAQFTDVKQLWFSVDESLYEWLTDDVYDAFLITLLYPAMFYGENIEVCGNVSKKIFHNVQHYVQGLIRAYDPSFYNISIKVQGFHNAAKADHLHVGTGFSGGIDSFSTLNDNFFNIEDTDYKIDTLFFFHVGQYGNVNKEITWKRANNRYTITENFAKGIGVNSIMMSTNMFDIYLPQWEYDAGVLCRIASVLVFQKSLKRYYISNTVTYRELSKMNFTSHHVDMAEMSDPIIMPLLSPIGLDILCDGAQHTRTEKTANIIDIPLAQKYLNVCVNSSDNHVEATNCSCCSKCLRTLMALESADALYKFKNVFDLSKWKKLSYKYKCELIYKYNHDSFAQDNIDFARSRGKKLPSKPIAFCVVYCHKLYTFPKKVLHKLKKTYGH